MVAKRVLVRRRRRRNVAAGVDGLPKDDLGGMQIGGPLALFLFVATIIWISGNIRIARVRGDSLRERPMGSQALVRHAAVVGGSAVVLLLACHLTGWPPRAIGQTAYCKSVEDCTTLIESGTLKGRELSQAYYYRSVARPLEDMVGRISDLSKAIEIDPRYESALSTRGTYYDYSRQYDRAIEDFTKVIDIVGEKIEHGRTEFVPKLITGYLERRQVYISAHKYDLAISDSSKLIEIYVHHQQALREVRISDGEASETARRAELYLEIGKPDKALADLNRVLELTVNPQKDYERGARAGRLYNRAKILEGFGRRDDAIADYREALRVDPPPGYRSKSSIDALKALGVEP